MVPRDLVRVQPEGLPDVSQDGDLPADQVEELVQVVSVNRQQAKALIRRVIHDLNDAEQAMLKLWEAKAWTVLGYDDWNAMCAAEFKALRELNRNSRKALVAGMTQRGMSTRAQAAVVGVSDQTVRADQVRENHAPAKVIGLDGKSYTRPIEAGMRRKDAPDRTVDHRSYPYSTTLALLTMTLRELERERAVDRLSNDVAEALREGDPEWVKATGTTICDLQHYLNQLAELVQAHLAPVPNGTARPEPPAVTAEPLYRHSVTVQLAREFVNTLRHDNAENRLAFDTRDALAAEDQNWIRDAEKALADLQAYLYRLQLVMENDSARHRAIVDPSRRDDLGRLVGPGPGR